jgi:TRAP-type C4-dicarboxylate transport system substrate-binding protein
VVVEWTQVPQAFEDGQIDTFLMPVAHLDLLPPHESVKYVTVVDYGYAPNLVIAVNAHEYRKWSPDIQTTLIEAAEEAGHYCTRQANAQTSTALERLSEEFRLPIIHPDKQAWRSSFGAAIKKVYEAVQLPRELYEELHSL